MQNIASSSDLKQQEPAETLLYIPAFLFVLSAVVLALVVPILAVFPSLELPALVALLFFFAPLLIAYAYLWRFGYLGWPVRTPQNGSTLS